MKTLLVIKPSSLGDIVHALQVVQTFARARPECRITWVVRERFAGLVQAAPFVHETVLFRRRDGWRAFLRLLRQLRGRRRSGAGRTPAKARGFSTAAGCRGRRDRGRTTRSTSCSRSWRPPA